MRLLLALLLLQQQEAWPAERVEVPDNACAQLQLTALTLSELCAAAEHSCTAAFGPSRQGRFSCEQVCGEAGLRCEAAFDDAFDDGRCPAGPPLPCSRPLHSKVCECRRVGCRDSRAGCSAGLSCVDGLCRSAGDGARCEAHSDCAEPWALCESGRCRAELLDLADSAGRARPQRGRQGRPSAPPERHQCELLHREVLVAADPATGTLEVQRLALALPTGAATGAPPAHVKVRAPDAEGHRMRVRAYSIMVDESAPRPHINMTVKIYPGGPPHSRGTSAFLGAVPVGEAVYVPQVRSMGWSATPAQIATDARPVGMLAFGVGIAEMLEPAAMLLAEGAREVRVVYASRDAGSILLQQELRGLLAAHSGRVSVSHYLSRQDEATAQCAAVDGERYHYRRIDGRAVKEEFGGWFGSGRQPLFLVVGTGAMERTAWRWLEQASGGGRGAAPLLRGGAGWVPLVPG